MIKKPKNVYLKRTLLLFLIFSLLIVPVSWASAQSISADEETNGEALDEVTASVNEQLTNEIREETEGKSTESVEHPDGTPPVAAPLEQSVEESLTAKVDRSALQARIEQLEQTVRVFVEKGLDEEVVAETQQMLQQAKNLLQKEKLTQEEMDAVLLQLTTQNETLAFLNNRTEIKIGTREASGDPNSDEALIGDSEAERKKVKQTISINKRMNKSNQTIDWTVTFTAFDGTWSNPRIYLWMPKNIGVTGLGSATDTYENTGLDSSSFNQKFQQTLGSNATDQRFVYNNLERLRETGDMARLLEYRSGNLNNNQSRTYTFTTQHDAKTDLDLVVLGATIQNGGFKYVRTLIKGRLGIEKHHELQLPKDIIYVVNQADLTATEKAKVKAEVMEETLAFYTRTGKTYEQSELTNLDPNDFVVANNGNVTVTWKDGTVSKLDVSSKVVQKDLQVSPKSQKVMDQSSIQEIKITGIGPDAMIQSIQPVGELPTGLNISPNADKTYSNTGTISNVAFPEGQETVDYTFKVKATDPTDGQVIEQSVTITVTPAPVPVGTHDRGYQLPVMMLTIGGLASLLAWLKLKARGDQIEW